MVVFSSKRLDYLYDALEKYSQQYWQAGFDRLKILHGRRGPLGFRPPPTATQEQLDVANGLALLYKAMESDSELSSTTHDVARQRLVVAAHLPETFQGDRSSLTVRSGGGEVEDVPGGLVVPGPGPHTPR